MALTFDVVVFLDEAEAAGDLDDGDRFEGGGVERASDLVLRVDKQLLDDGHTVARVLGAVRVA